MLCDTTYPQVRANGVNRPIVQDIPITIHAHDEIPDTVCPQLPVPEVNVYLPNIRLLRSVVERMKAIRSR